MSSNRICVGQTVTVSSQAVNPGYSFAYDGGTAPTLAVTTVSPIYSTPGTYTILQGVSGPRFACRTVEVVSTTALVGIDVKACTGTNSVTLTYTLTGDATKYNRLNVLWGDGGADNPAINGATGTGTLVHTYPMRSGPATYSIQVRGGFHSLACQSDPATKTVTVLNGATATNPLINSLTSSGNTIELRYQAPSGYTSEVYRKDPGGAFVSTGLINPTTSFSVTAPSDKTTCFQIISKDVCGATLRSSEVCSLVLNAQAATGENKLNWFLYAGTFQQFKGYRLYRNGAPISGFIPLGTTSYTDNSSIECKPYCYTLEANQTNLNGETISRSASVCVNGIDGSGADGPTAAFVSVNSSGGVDVVASLSANAPTTYTLIVARADSPNGSFTDIASISNDRKYADASAQTSRQRYCYQAALLNSCGVRSTFTKPACTVFLQTASDGKTLEWTGDSPFFPDGQPVKYTIVPVDGATGGTLSPIDPPANATTYKIDATNQSTRFYIAAYDKDGVLVSYSNTVDIQLSPSLLIPSAFSPNGDGENNTFMPKGLFWETLDMTVFDRWGATVFNTTSKDSTGWDGTINGNPAPTGYYTYRVRITDASGRAFERAGRVLLLR